ncbi:MAG: GAF domain-containing protein [Candidatus Natronoplasma sp.]
MTIKVLLVDDESLLLEQAKVFIEKKGGDIEVLTETSAKGALNRLDDEDIDLIVADYQMPRMDGLEFLKKVRDEKEMKGPFIIFTGKGREEVAMKALNLGADRYIKKEGDPKSQFDFLIQVITREIDRYNNKKEKKERERKIKELYKASTEIGAGTSESEIYKLALSSAQEILGFEASIICMLEDEDLVVRAANGTKIEVGERHSKDEGIRGLTFKNKESYLIDDLSNWEEAQPSDPDFKSAISIPIKDEGIFQVLSYQKGHFDESDLDLTEILVSQMVQAIERVRSREEIKKNEKRYRMIFESANDGIIILDGADFKFIDCNEKTLEMFECDREDIIGSSPWDFSPEKQPDGRRSKEKAIEKIDSALQDEPQYSEWVHTTEKDETFHAEVSLNRYTIDDNNYVLGVVRDVSDRKEAEERLRESKEKIERLHSISAELETCRSEEKIYNLTVKVAEDILDFDICAIQKPEDGRMEPTAFSSGFPEDGYPAPDPLPIDDSLAGKTYSENRSFLAETPEDYDVINPTSEKFRSGISVPIGEFGVFQAVSTEEEHFDEEDLHMVELLIDHVSEALKRTQILEREDFLHSLMRHDVGNKSKIVRGYLELMKDHDLPEEVEDFIEKAERAAQDGLDIIEKIRKLRKIEEEEEIKTIDLRSVPDKIRSEYAERLEEKCISLEVEEKSCSVVGGPLLHDLFSNLIENSIRHADCEKISIRYESEGDRCKIRVEDDGKGIPDEYKERICEKGFKRGSGSGTGLGMYMVKEIINSYDGEIEVKDSEMGGARFDLYLPKPE